MAHVYVDSAGAVAQPHLSPSRPWAGPASSAQTANGRSARGSRGEAALKGGATPAGASFQLSLRAVGQERPVPVRGGACQIAAGAGSTGGGGESRQEDG